MAAWIAGVYLSGTTDALDCQWNLGAALGGMILLSVSGSLPEVAITISAAAQHNLALAAGNLIGGIAMQTMVLAVCDIFVKGKKPLTYLVGNLMPVLEAFLVTVIVSTAFMDNYNRRLHGLFFQCHISLPHVKICLKRRVLDPFQGFMAQ